MSIHTWRYFDESETGEFADVAIYDFNIHGGAIGDIPLGLTIPAWSIILYSLVLPIDTVLSAGAATVSMSLQPELDLLGPTATPINTTPTTDQNWIIDNAILTTSDRDLRLKIAGNPLTAGKLEIRLYGYRSYALAEFNS